MPAERSIGGRFNPPVTSIVQRLSNGRSARNFFSSAGRILQAEHADIDFGPRLGRHHVGPRAAAKSPRDSP